MKKNKLFDKSMLLFLLVGIANTLLSAVLMLLLENLGYWPSTVIAYTVGAALSFFLNRCITFKSNSKLLSSAVKFAINVAVCYIIAYSAAQPLVSLALKHTAVSDIWRERISKLFGMGLYTVINYFGQRFFAFCEKKNNNSRV